MSFEPIVFVTDQFYVGTMRGPHLQSLFVLAALAGVFNTLLAHLGIQGFGGIELRRLFFVFFLFFEVVVAPDVFIKQRVGRAARVEYDFVEAKA